MANKVPHLIVHAGLHKTGSSSLQASLVKADLNDATYLAWRPRVNHSEAFSNGFEEDGFRKGRLAKNEPADERRRLSRQIFAEQMQSCTTSRMIISGERISAVRHDVMIDFIEFARQFADRISVFAYVRPPISFLESGFQQRIKDGARSEFIPRGLDQMSRCKTLDEAFGRENVTFAKFDRADLVDGDVVLDFSMRYDLQLAKADVVQRNESLSLESLSILFAHTSHGALVGRDGIAPQVRRLMLEGCAKVGESKWGFGPDLYARAADVTKEARAYLEDRLEVDFSEQRAVLDRPVNSADDLIAVGAPYYEEVERKARAFAAVLGPRGSVLLEGLSKAQAQDPGPERMARVIDAVCEALKPINPGQVNALRKQLIAA